jgi:hypothetical protein
VKLTILQRAQELIFGDRAKSYGPASENHGNTAAFYRLWVTARYQGQAFQDDAFDSLAFNIGQKLSRLAFNLRTTGRIHEDSVLDGAGYFGLFEKVQAEIDEAAK